MAKYQFVEQPDTSTNYSIAGLSFTIYSLDTVYAGFRVVSSTNRLRCVLSNGQLVNIYVNNLWWFPDGTQSEEPAVIDIDLDTVEDESFKEWFLANTEPYVNKLATPTNVSVEGTKVIWGKVENATSYDILVDGEVWDTVVVSSGETWVLNETVSSLSLLVSK